MSDELRLPPSPKGPGPLDTSAVFQDPEFASLWLRAIIDSADDAIVTKTLDGVITSWNSGAERIFGYTAAEAIGQPVTMLIPPDHPNEEPSIIEKLRRGERIEHYETVRVHKDGSLIDISLTVSPIQDPTGKVVGASKVARDISERRQTERRLREESEVLETVNRLGQVLAAELDLHKLVQAATDAATGISGAQFGSFFYNVLNEAGESYMLYTLSGVPRESFAQFPMPRNTDIFSPTFNGKGTVRLADVTKDPSYGRNSPYFGMPEGHLPVTSYLAVPVLSRSGEVLGGLFFGHPEPDVFTERAAKIVEGLAAQVSVAMDNARLFDLARRERTAAEAAAAESERLYQEAQQSNRLKDEFLAIISHEVRTPLTSILGWAQLLRNGQVPVDEIERALEVIERNALTQTHIIDDLLDVSRIITGKLRLDVRQVVPQTFIEAAIEAVTPAAQAKRITLEKVLDSGVLSVAGDPVRLQQIVWNLLSNAIKFTPKDGWVLVKLALVNSHIEISVSDSGLGFDPEFAPHLFDRFRQADQRTTRRHGGLGLGLAIVRHLCEMHGGSVWAESPGEGRGATFTVTLPVAPAPSRDDEDRPTGPFANASFYDLPERLDGLTILIVDDEADTRGWLEAGLSLCGAEVVTAASAQGALKAIESGIPDLMISDIGMPGEDGYHLIRCVRQLAADRGASIPAVALTAYARTEDRLRALRAGYQMHVAKPVELSELVAVAVSLTRKSY